jgi:BirA family transcriptional regulator, biotin operon repressor / biotin---[acetyl-CoA-carboxylase] ligase
VLRHHLASTPSTNDVARELAAAGAPAGTVVTAREQTAGRGRQGRAWAAPPGQALIASVVVRPFGPLLPLAAAVAVADVAGEHARIKWPNDVLVDGRKVAGILVEARPAEGWAVVGVGLNAAVELDALPAEVRARAATLGRRPDELDAVLAELLAALDGALALDDDALLERWRARDALVGREVSWGAGRGTALGVDRDGHLLVERPDGGREALSAGEVHLGT